MSKTKLEFLLEEEENSKSIKDKEMNQETQDSATTQSVEELQKKVQELEKRSISQRRMMLNDMLGKNENPFSRALQDNEVENIDKINAYLQKYANGGLLHTEIDDMYRLMNVIIKGREESLGHKEIGTIEDSNYVPLGVDELRVLNAAPPPGYRGYWEVDTPALNGRRIKEKLRLGYRFMQNDGLVKCEADGAVWNPDTSQSGIVFRHGKTYGNPPQPATYYLMVIADSIYNERKKKHREDRVADTQRTVEGSYARACADIKKAGGELEANNRVHVRGL